MERWQHSHTHPHTNAHTHTQHTHTHTSGGVGGPAGPALAVALFDGVMNINIELATGPPHFTRHYVLLRTFEIRGSDRNGSS